MSLFSFFLCTYVWSSTEWLYHGLFTPSPAEGHLGCFLLLAITNKAALSLTDRLCVNVSFHFP